MAIHFMNRTSFQSLLARGLSCWFAGLAMTAAAQSQSPGPNPDPNVPVAIPPDAQVQLQPAVQPQPSGGHGSDFFRIEKVTKDDDWTRHFRIGAMVGMNISANFSMNGTFNIPGNNAANGNYDDGYVRVDNTGNDGGLTTYWGYNNQDQYSAANHTLTMRSTSSFSPTSGTSAEQSGSAFAGFDMAYGGNLFYWGRARIGWDLGFGLLPVSITDTRPMSASVSQNIYTFDTRYVSGQMPPAGYQGGPGGGPWLVSNPLSVTNNVPVPGGGNVTGSHTLDVMLYTVRIGPSVYWDLNENFGLSASFGPAIGIVSGDYKYDETITTGATSAHNQGKFGTTDVVYGGYVNATLMYHVPNENADIYLGAQYMPMGNASFSGGGREAQLKLGGQVYISAGVNWAF